MVFPASVSASPRFRVWLPGSPVTCHSEPLPDASVQTTPVPEGSVSLTCRPVAVTSPLFASVTVKPIWPPASTVAASAVLLIDTVVSQEVSVP